MNRAEKDKQAFIDIGNVIECLQDAARKVESKQDLYKYVNTIRAAFTDVSLNKDTTVTMTVLLLGVVIEVLDKALIESLKGKPPFHCAMLVSDRVNKLLTDIKDL